MAERTSYPERRRDMELQLLRELREKEEKGFIVLVGGTAEFGKNRTLS
ncbi:hypothetical protein VEE28_47780 (plasmid) [Escherichia coli]|nr:hypothetical protein VEE28_47780 [Escherichia coli]